MKLDKEQRVPIDVAESRALKCLTRSPVPASYVADHIWPDHEMTRQGAGAAASRILKRLEKKGLVRWTADARRWGWVRR